MNPILSPYLWAIRAMSVIGLAALCLTGELEPAYCLAGICTFMLSFILDRLPKLQRRFRRLETPVVVVLILQLVLDMTMRHQTIFIAVAHFLILFQVFKWCGLKERKDAFQIFLFGFFQLLAACTLSVDVWQAALLLAVIPVGAAGLYWNSVQREADLSGIKAEGRTRTLYLRMGLGISTGAIPTVVALTAFVFLVFPRLTLNASLPGFGNAHIGYTDRINLSQSGTLKGDETIVLWLSFPDDRIRMAWDGYLRGSTLSQFDGRLWSPAKQTSLRTLTPDGSGWFRFAPTRGREEFTQEIMLIDPSASTVFMAGRPLAIHAPLPSLQRDEAGSVHWSVSWKRPLRYQITATYSAAALASDSKEDPSALTNVGLASLALGRLASLARTITAGATTDDARAHQIERYLRTKYAYSLDLPSGSSENPVEDFLFQSRRGPCGYFASAMAVLLRLEGIPARVVAGYYRGEWNEPAKQFTIREKDAHAWVEAYLLGQGWVRFDPSPRSTTSSASARRWHSVRQYMDYMGLKWNNWVIQYDLYAQLRAFERVRRSSESLNDQVAVWMSRPRKGSSSITEPTVTSSKQSLPYKTLLFFAVLLASAGAYARPRTPSSLPNSARDYLSFLNRMARRGHTRRPEETGLEFAQRMEREDPSKKEVVWEATRRYYQLRFSRSHDPYSPGGPS